MPRRASLFDFQFENAVVYDDLVPFRLTFEDPERRKLYEAALQEAEQLIWKGTFDRLAQDVFFSFYNKDLDIRPADFMKLQFLLNHMLIDHLVKEKSHQQFRTGLYNTIHNRQASYQAFVIFTNKLLDNIKQYLSEQDQKDLAKLEDKAQAVQDSDEALSKQKGLSPQEKRKLLAKQKEQQKGLRRDLQNYTARTGDAYRRSLNEAIEETQKEIREADEAMRLMLGGPFRGYEEGELQKIPIHERIELAKKLRKVKDLKRLVDHIGRFRLIAAQKQVEKLSNVPQEYTDIKKGDDLENLLPEEYFNLGSNPTQRADFLQRFLQQSLLEMERTPKKEKISMGKGSIIICVDTSGSMTGEKEFKAKALALSIADIAYLQKRNFACILFSSRNEVDVVKILPDEKMTTTAEKVIKIAANFYGGGTDFESPLKKAIQIIEEDEYNNGDIIFLTDGYADLPKDFLATYQKVKKEKGFRTVGLLCDSSDSDRDQGKAVLDTFCDDTKFNSEIEKDDSFNTAEDFAKDIFLEL